MSTPTFENMRPELGQPVAEIETPTVVADLDVIDRNIDRFQRIASDNDVAIRSHTKAHKTPALARRQTAAFAGGVLCQKLSEAEVMARHGIDDILLVCPVVTEPKVSRLCWVAQHVDHFATIVDGRNNAAPLQAAGAARDITINVVVEVDVGLRRMGVEPGDAAVDLVDYIAAQPNLSFDGLLGHDGHVPYLSETAAEYEQACETVAEDLEATVDALETAGYAVERVVSGASGTAHLMAQHDVVTELDPGRYILNDANLLENGRSVEAADCGATVLTTVIARPTEDRAIVDAGSKTVSYVDEPDPVPVGRDDIRFVRKSSEHGFVDVSDAASAVEVGDRLEFIVPNLWAVMNLHDRLVGRRDDHVAEVWRVEARGKDT